MQSTLAGAAFFLLAGVIADQRGGASDYFKAGPQPAIWVKIAFLILATTVAGLPPFSGFVGKLMLLTTLRAVSSGTAIWVAIWVVLLASSFIVMIALARDGCLLIWEHEALAGQPPAEGIAWQRATATLLLVAAGPLLALFARPLADYAERAANQLHTPGAYVAGVLAPTAAKNGGEEAR